MTEDEWLVCADSERMLIALACELRHTSRRSAVFAATFAESGRVCELLAPGLRAPFDALVRWTRGDGPHPSTVPANSFDPLECRLWTHGYWVLNDAVERLVTFGGATWLEVIALATAEAYNESRSPDAPELRRLQPDTLAWKARQAARLRDVVGNPFRPAPAFAPEWRTETAVLLARQMSSSRDFSAMPILADALQDAGCDSDEVLRHCREETEGGSGEPAKGYTATRGEHVRGCWVCDLVLAVL